MDKDDEPLAGYMLDMRKYPAYMYMNMYGDGSQCWDTSSQHDSAFGVIFRVKYIRADIALDELQKAVMKATDFISVNQLPIEKEVNNG